MEDQYQKYSASCTSQYIEDITADITVEDPKGKLNYLKAQAEESATPRLGKRDSGDYRGADCRH